MSCSGDGRRSPAVTPSTPSSAPRVRSWPPSRTWSWPWLVPWFPSPSFALPPPSDLDVSAAFDGLLELAAVTVEEQGGASVGREEDGRIGRGHCEGRGGLEGQLQGLVHAGPLLLAHPPASAAAPITAAPPS